MKIYYVIVVLAFSQSADVFAGSDQARLGIRVGSNDCRDFSGPSEPKRQAIYGKLVAIDNGAPNQYFAVKPPGRSKEVPVNNGDILELAYKSGHVERVVIRTDEFEFVWSHQIVYVPIRMDRRRIFEVVINEEFLRSLTSVRLIGRVDADQRPNSNSNLGPRSAYFYEH